MILRTAPMVQDGVPQVSLEVGDSLAQLPSKQAEDVGECLIRAATAARYEAAIGVVLKKYEFSEREQLIFIQMVRESIEQKRVSHN